MNALVTGAAGFLGRYVVEQLIARGDRVRALVRRPDAALETLGAEVVLGDIRDRAAISAACHGVDAVFHTAALAGIWGTWQAYYSTNAQGTKNVIDACRAYGVRRLVFSSSPSVTFDGADQENIDESAPFPDRWLAHYPHTKALAEQAVLEANGVDGLLTCALRPHLIWGPRDRHLIPRVLDRARRGRLRRVGDGRNRIDTIYVENAAAAHLMAADALTPGSAVAGNAYFISQGEPVLCWQWIDRILDLVGLPPVEKSISLAAAWRLGATLEAIYRSFRIRTEPPMTRFLAAQLGRSHYFNIERASRDFGYRPLVSTEEGLRRLKESLAGSVPPP